MVKSHRLRVWATLLVALHLSTRAHAEAPESLPMQDPEARSIGTSTNLQAASKTLLQRFGGMSRDGSHITVPGLRAAAGVPGKLDPETGAVRFFLSSPVARELAGDRGGITRDKLQAIARAMTPSEFEESVLSLIQESKDDTTAVARILRDPGIPDTVRERILKRYSDDQLLSIFGRPHVTGSPQDVHDVSTAFLFLIRLSWLGATEADLITRYHVDYRISHGPKDRGLSFWNGHFVQFSDTMLSENGVIDAAALRKHIGTLAHESGHAIYDLSGTKKRFQADMARAGMTPGMNGIVDEAIAGVCQNRAHVSVGGFGANKDSDANLVLLHDIGKNIASVDTGYAKYYHVDIEKAHAQLGMIAQLIAQDILPFLETDLDLVDDPQLADGVPTAAGSAGASPVR